MNEKRLAGILNRCLDEIAAGEAVEACLAQYPEYAAELRPLLAMAGELGMLSQYHVSDAARVHAKMQLRRAGAARRDQRARSQGRLRLGLFLTPRAAAGLAAILLCVLLTVGTVAASGPGDLAYGLRIAAERIPARLTPSAEARARAELGLATRRLADLDRTMRSQDQALDERTISALLADLEMAAEMATSLPEPERVEIAARIAEQAQRVTQLIGSARNAQQAEALQAASGRAYRAAERAWTGPVSPTPQPAGPLHEPTRSPTAAPHSTLTPERTPFRVLLPPRPRRQRLRLQPAQAIQRRAMPADSGRRLRRRPRPRLGGIPRRQRLQALVRLRPPRVSARPRLHPVPARLRPRPALDLPRPPQVPARLQLRPAPDRLRPPQFPIRQRLRPAPDPLHRTQDRVRPLVTRPNRGLAAIRAPNLQP